MEKDVSVEDILKNAKEVNLNGYVVCKVCCFPDTVLVKDLGNGKVLVKCNICGTKFKTKKKEESTIESLS